MSDDRLSRYRDKRTLTSSHEPAAGHERGARFVVQKHDASRLHYDFRLAVAGVLKSWAVPKGPSTDPREKRLAVQVEDHPLDYADFEGTIPAGHYGAGTVMVWDHGGYRNLRADNDSPRDMEQSHQEGLIEIWLDGEKIRGGYALKRFREGDKPQWLLIKMSDDQADARRRPTHTENRSVLSGKTLAGIARAAGQDRPKGNHDD
ncbi:DNA polymerase ligase N-terminal domain-containing protein [Alloalcanivorax mobilis]|uniref:DNA polymerase ligase N-terminal domain-containing protein n=1 Tax=Alloalcanivorax mobilis TaxID=2019569 RepID=UPI000B5B3E89|nr:DNA polymerase ligase N-terminal domain-containing protein [Alloalcanivorax mobilis]ASK35725.1 DNA ligase [Alcanivorax sp. N3-2A]|tara:strand:+ start:14293 stop:14904 length:612 start_codon:yes stop_codon:yes gene_type:complete